MNKDTATEYDTSSDTDLLFGDRFEDRFTLRSDALQELSEKINLPEDETQSQWVTTLYLNTDEHTLLTGTAVRFREYSKNKSTISLEDRKGFVDYNTLLYNKKQKKRKEAYLSEILHELNQTYPIRYSDFRVIFAILYKRRVFQNAETRITIDHPVQCFRVSDDKIITEIETSDYAQVEVKRNTLNTDHVSLIHRLGGKRTIPKYYSLYNLEYTNDAESKYDAYFDDSCGYEYEKKLTLESEEIYNEFVVKTHKNEVDGYKLVEKLPNPYCFTSINEYRNFRADGTQACIMHTGNEIQRISKKDTGQVLKNNILKRTKTEIMLPESKWKQMMEDEVVGVSFRMKKIFFVESLKTGIIYGVIMDQSQKQDGRMYQLEIEYAMSTKSYENNLEENIIGEIEEVASYFKQRGSKDSLVKKQEWVGRG